jgi:mannose-6-phosphate isomerase-like protein (cupin superfamily)
MKAICTTVFAVLSVAALQAQDSAPTCHNCPASYVSAEEIKAYLDRAPALAAKTGVADQPARTVDFGKGNVVVAVVYRPKMTAQQPVTEHDLVSEVYYVLDGEGTLVTGPDITGGERRPGSKNISGTGIRNGQTYNLKAGDAVIIPAGTGHWFTRIDDHIRYMNIRIDPEKTTPLKDEAASKADLAGKAAK